MAGLTSITAKGSPFELGQQIGMAVRDAVHQVSVHNEEFRLLEDRWAGSSYADDLLKAAEAFRPDFVTELRGMADAVGLPFERLFLWNCRGDLRLPEEASELVKNGAADGCTTLMIPGHLDRGQSHTIAHNEDGSDDLYGHCFWLSAEPEEGTAFESYLYPGMMPGHTLGVNATGLVQTINNIRVHDLKPGIPRHFVCRAVLDCQTLDQAVEILERTDRASGFHHNLGQAGDQRLLSVEAPASGCEVVEVTAPAAHANHLIRPCFDDLDQTVTASSHARQARAQERVEAGNVSAEAILFDRSNPGKTIHRIPGDGSDDYGRTLVTGIFHVGAGGVSWALHDGPDHLNILSS